MTELCLEGCIIHFGGGADSGAWPTRACLRQLGHRKSSQEEKLASVGSSEGRASGDSLLGVLRICSSGGRDRQELEISGRALGLKETRGSEGGPSCGPTAWPQRVVLRLRLLWAGLATATRAPSLAAVDLTPVEGCFIRS